MDNIFGNIQDGQQIIGVRSLENNKTMPERSLVDLLKRALVEETIAWFQYNSVRDVLVGRERPSIVEFFKQAEMDEMYDHAEKLKQRLTELGDDLQFLQTQDMRALFERTPNTFIPLNDLSTQAAVLLNINAEKAAIDTYNLIISQARDINDHVTCLMAKEILTDEEQHLRVLKDFAADLGLEY